MDIRGIEFNVLAQEQALRNSESYLRMLLQRRKDLDEQIFQQRQYIRQQFEIVYNVRREWLENE